MSFKKPKKIREYTFHNITYTYEWNKNTKKLEKIEKDFQLEIDKFKGTDLKTLVNKNIMPKDNDKLHYIDSTIYKDLDITRLHNLSDVELVEIKENEKETNKENNKVVEKEPDSGTDSK